MTEILSIAAERRIGPRTVLTLSSHGRIAGQVEIRSEDVADFKRLLTADDDQDRQIENVVKMLHRGEAWQVINRITRCPAEKIEEISRIMEELEKIRSEETILYFTEEVPA